MGTRLAVLFVAGCSFAAAAEFEWPGKGTLSLDAPPTWAVDGRQIGKWGFRFHGGPKSKSAAALEIIVSTSDKPIEEDRLVTRLGWWVQLDLKDSVEKKFSPVALRMSQGRGWYAELTDASLVGKAPKKSDVKVKRHAMAALDEHTLVQVTMRFDDPAGPEPAEMLAIVETLRASLAHPAPAPPNPEAIQVNTGKTHHELSGSASRLVLKLPKDAIGPHDFRDASPEMQNPRYFKFSSNAFGGMMVSGRFEPAALFTGLNNFWGDELAAWKRVRIPAPTSVHFETLNGWELICYEIPARDAASYHVLAEFVRDGTWLDLHVSITAARPVANLRADIIAFMAGIVVDTR